ncbi:MAG TPA: PLP-dependent aminotransferase family protein [Meiothermus sp.]|nr:PLP-dependent aminotransferase family protein [Meiothermus sp.]
MGNWESRFAERMGRIKSSAIREILKVTQQPGIISFAGGLPAPDLFPVEEMRRAADKVLGQYGATALQYSTTEGYLPLREWVASGLPNATPDQVLITAGSQQALDLVGKLFVGGGDEVVVESPTYLGALQSFTPYEPVYLTVPMDEGGMVVEALEETLKQHRPKFIYALPSFQNPTGRHMDLARRKKLVEVARRYDVPLLEDDAYHYLAFSGQILPTLYELDQELGGGNVIYQSTFSKTLSPGLRVAWVVGPREVISRLVQLKQGVDLHTPTLNQMLMYELAQTVLPELVVKIRNTYRERRDLMLAALEQHLAKEARWNKPEGGMFLWLEISEGLDSAELLKKAVEQKVAFVPGQPFHPDGSGANTMRLSFSNASPEGIRVGIERLGQAVRSMLLTVKG